MKFAAALGFLCLLSAMYAHGSPATTGQATDTAIKGAKDTINDATTKRKRGYTFGDDSSSSSSEEYGNSNTVRLLTQLLRRIASLSSRFSACDLNNYSSIVSYLLAIFGRGVFPSGFNPSIEVSGLEEIVQSLLGNIDGGNRGAVGGGFDALQNLLDNLLGSYKTITRKRGYTFGDDSSSSSEEYGLFVEFNWNGYTGNYNQLFQQLRQILGKIKLFRGRNTIPDCDVSYAYNLFGYFFYLVFTNSFPPGFNFRLLNDLNIDDILHALDNALNANTNPFQGGVLGDLLNTVFNLVKNVVETVVDLVNNLLGGVLGSGNGILGSGNGILGGVLGSGNGILG